MHVKNVCGAAPNSSDAKAGSDGLNGVHREEAVRHVFSVGANSNAGRHGLEVGSRGNVDTKDEDLIITVRGLMPARKGAPRGMRQEKGLVGTGGKPLPVSSGKREQAIGVD